MHDKHHCGCLQTRAATAATAFIVQFRHSILLNWNHLSSRRSLYHSFSTLRSSQLWIIWIVLKMNRPCVAPPAKGNLVTTTNIRQETTCLYISSYDPCSTKPHSVFLALKFQPPNTRANFTRLYHCLLALRVQEAPLLPLSGPLPSRATRLHDIHINLVRFTAVGTCLPQKRV